MHYEGLGDLLAWGMGSTTSHNVIAHRVNGTLMICESEDST